MNMNNDYVLSVIREYADDRLREPRYCLPRSCFEQRSYQKWAVDEILKNIEKSKFTPPIMVVENFIRKMDDFSCRNKKTSFIFSVAHDVAKDILDVLITMKWAYRKEKKDESIKKTGSNNSGGGRV